MLAPSFSPGSVFDIMHLKLGKMPKLRVTTAGKIVSDIGGMELKKNV